MEESFMQRICVYSGSNSGLRPQYKEGAQKLGQSLAKNKLELVYGGSNIGLMGTTANEVLKNNGSVTGVIPKNLFSGEIVHRNLTKLIEVKNMSERKQKMAELADGFITLPGGLGTFEELFEMLSWAQLGIHKKPIGLLNICNFFDPLIKMLEKAAEEGFMDHSNLDLILLNDNPEKLIEEMVQYTPPESTSKWQILNHK